MQRLRSSKADGSQLNPQDIGPARMSRHVLVPLHVAFVPAREIQIMQLILCSLALHVAVVPAREIQIMQLILYPLDCVSSLSVFIAVRVTSGRPTWL